jgi:hypothetical protein
LSATSCEGLKAKENKRMHFTIPGVTNIPNVSDFWTKFIIFLELLKWVKTTWLKNI